jgi:hypothetical protein
MKLILTTNDILLLAEALLDGADYNYESAIVGRRNKAIKFHDFRRKLLNATEIAYTRDSSKSNLFDEETGEATELSAEEKEAIESREFLPEGQ